MYHEPLTLARDAPRGSRSTSHRDAPAPGGHWLRIKVRTCQRSPVCSSLLSKARGRRAGSAWGHRSAGEAGWALPPLPGTPIALGERGRRGSGMPSLASHHSQTSSLVSPLIIPVSLTALPAFFSPQRRHMSLQLTAKQQNPRKEAGVQQRLQL